MALIYVAAHVPSLVYWLNHPEELEITFRNQSLIDTFSSPPELRSYHYVDTPEEATRLPDGRTSIPSLGHWDTVQVKRFK